MAIFSTNSVRHLYVANAASGTTPGCFNEAKLTADKELYLTFVNANSQVRATDLIPVSRIKKVSSKAYVAQALRKDTITFDNLVAGQTYTVRILLRQWGSGSQENQYIKYVGSYKAITGATQETLVDSLIASAAKNFSREPISMFTFTRSGSSTSAKLVVEEVAQPFVRGKQQGRALDYVIQYVKINDAAGFENTTWGVAESTTKPKPGLGTGRIASDMEYFFLGERGDVYRNVGYPYTFDTVYLVDQTKQYDIIDIVYNSGDSGAIGETNAEKYLTVLCENSTSSAVAKAIVLAVNTATGASTLANPS